MQACETPEGGLAGTSATGAQPLTAAREAEQRLDYKTASTHYTQALEADGDSLEAALGQVRTLRITGDVRAASQSIEQSLARHGDKVVLLIEMAKLQVAMDRQTRAVEVLERARVLEPRNWQILSLLGVAHDYQHNHTAAEQLYRQALEISPENPVVLNNLALSLAQGQRLAEAIAVLQDAVRTPEATIQMRQNLAMLKALDGDLATAQRLAERDLPIDMAHQNIEYYRYLTERR